jgi:hypothetical protein
MAQFLKASFPYALNARHAGVVKIKTDTGTFDVRRIKTDEPGLELFFLRDALKALGMHSPCPSLRDLRRVPEGAIFLCPAGAHDGTGAGGARLITRAGLRCFVEASVKPNRKDLLAWIDRKPYRPAPDFFGSNTGPSYDDLEAENATLRDENAKLTALIAANGYSFTAAA